MNKVIFEKTTRVIRRLTTDDVPSIASDEDFIVVADDFTLQPNTKLDDKDEVVPASVDELKQADPVFKYQEKIKNFQAACDIAINDPTTSQALKDLIGYLKTVRI